MSEGEPSLERSSGVMAAGTLASRATGFLRVVSLAAALGIGLHNGLDDPYNIANTTPNIVYELLLGGVLTSVVVPLFVRAANEDDDGGTAFVQTFLGLVVLVLGAAVVVGVLAAPLIAALLGAEPGAERDVTTTLLRWFLPQIFFYGVGATIGAILNTRGRFGAPMAAPAVNNLVVVATALSFIALSGGGTPRVDTVTGTQLTLLGAGTTFGVVAMTLALLPSLRASGFRWGLRIARHPRLRDAARLGSWVLVYVLANQAGYYVVIRLAKAAAEGGVTAYQYAFILFQLPHAIVTVSVVTALVPRLAAHAVADRRAELRGDLSRGMRLTAVLLVPAALGLLVLADPVATAVFRYRSVTPEGARFVAQVLTAFAAGLVSFSAFQLLLRVFYALHDSRTPALVNVGCNALNVAVDLALFALLDGRARVVGLAAGHAVAYTAGAVTLALLLRRRLGGLDGSRVVRTLVRAAVAGLLGALAAWGVVGIGTGVLGDGRLAAWVSLLAGIAVGAGVYVVSARRMHLREFDVVVGLVAARLRR